MKSWHKDLILFCTGLLGQMLAVAGLGLLVVSFIAQFLLNIPAFTQMLIAASMMFTALILAMFMVWLEGKTIDENLCQCPCGCKNKPDGLEDLCHYCMENHEDLRREFIPAKDDKK